MINFKRLFFSGLVLIVLQTRQSIKHSLMFTFQFSYLTIYILAQQSAEFEHLTIQNYVSLTNIIEFYILVSTSGNSVYKYIIEIYKILVVPLSSLSWSIVDTSISSSSHLKVTCSSNNDLPWGNFLLFPEISFLQQNPPHAKILFFLARNLHCYTHHRSRKLNYGKLRMHNYYKQTLPQKLNICICKGVVLVESFEISYIPVWVMCRRYRMT
jgi:hypothetical protein